MINIRKFLGLDYFTSEIDQFIIDFDQSHPKLSTSQRREKEKYARIGKLRDDSRAIEQHDDFWHNF